MVTPLALLAAWTTAHAAPALTGGYHGDLLTHPGAFAGLSWTVAEAQAFTFRVGTDLGA